MSNHTYTFTALQNAVLYGTGKSAGFGSLLTAANLVNDAIEEVCRANDWTWLRKPLSLDFTAYALTSLVRASSVVTATRTAHGLQVGDAIRITGSAATTNGFDGVFVLASVPTANTFTYAQSGADETATTAGSYIPAFVTLPSDFASLHVIRRVGAFAITVPVAIEEITELRSSPISSVATCLYYCIGTSPQASVTAHALRRLEMFPAPASAASGAVIGSYLRLLPALSGGTDLPDVPAGYFQLIKLACMAQGEAQVDEKRGGYQQKYEQELERAIARDGGVQRNLGRILGGTAPPIRSDPFAGWPISAPA